MELFATWTKRKREIVIPQSYTSHDGLAEIVRQLLLVYGPKPHLCYHNAAKACEIDPQIEYVLGWVETDSDVIEHAWNYWRGIHFDLTQEIGYSGKAALRRYTKVTSIAAPRLREIAGLWTAPTVFDAYLDEVSPLPPLPIWNHTTDAA